MINVETVIEACTGCSACSNVCPKGCINMQRSPNGFLYPVIDLNTCIDCHQCENVCMAINGSNELFQNTNNSKYYAAWATKDNMAPKATSGGVASVLSKIFFVENGHVFGAAFTDGIENLQQIECVSEEDIKAITGSKYLQSNPSKTFFKVKEYLRRGDKVLYIGTPCQIGGLKKYLKKEYDNLYTIDFFCHGVPSPLAWEKYVSYLQDKYHATLVAYNFRAKLSGWGKLEQSAVFLPSRSFKEVGPFNTFHTWFGKHLSIRRSCFQCQFRNDKRVSDITVADFWKIEQFYPHLPTKQGVSCVILNNRKGKYLFEKAINSGQIICYDASYESVWGKRKTTQANFEMPLERTEFMQDLATLSAKDLIKKYHAQTPSQVVLDKLKSLIR